MILRARFTQATGFRSNGWLAQLRIGDRTTSEKGEISRQPASNAKRLQIKNAHLCVPRRQVPTDRKS